MNYGTELLIAWHMFLDWLKSVFGSNLYFPTAQGYVEGYSK